jgi:cytochrome c-type biogenesis protein CcmH/NrfG
MNAGSELPQEANFMPIFQGVPKKISDNLPTLASNSSTFRLMAALVLVAVTLLLATHAVRKYGARILIARTTDAMDRRQTPAALAFAQQAVALDPRSGPAWFFLGQNLLANGQPPQALDALLKARPFFAHRPSTLRLLGQTYLQLNQLDLAAEAFAWSLRLAPTPPAEPVVRRQMSLALYRAGRFGESLHAQFLAMRRDPTAEFDLQAMRINSATLAGLPQLAAAAIRSGLAMPSPRQPSTEQLRELILLAAQLQRLPQAETTLRLASATTMDPIRTACALAAVLSQQGRRNEAAQTLNTLIDLHVPKDPEPYLLHLDLLAADPSVTTPTLRQAVDRFSQRFPLHPELPNWRNKDASNKGS